MFANPTNSGIGVWYGVDDPPATTRWRQSKYRTIEIPMVSAHTAPFSTFVTYAKQVAAVRLTGESMTTLFLAEKFFCVMNAGECMKRIGKNAAFIEWYCCMFHKEVTLIFCSFVTNMLYLSISLSYNYKTEFLIISSQQQFPCIPICGYSCGIATIRYSNRKYYTEITIHFELSSNWKSTIFTCLFRRIKMKKTMREPIDNEYNAVVSCVSAIELHESCVNYRLIISVMGIFLNASKLCGHFSSLGSSVTIAIVMRTL